MSRVVAVLAALCGVVVFAASASARVLRVGTFHGVRGQFSSVQAAVKAAKPGDWILVAPGDYKTKPNSISTPKGNAEFPAGVLISKPNLHLRGMNRNSVIIDGTKPGSAVCSKSASAQNFGLKGPGCGVRLGLRARRTRRRQCLTLRRQREQQRVGRQRSHGLQGLQRLGPEPDRLQLPVGLARLPATRSGGTAAPTPARCSRATATSVTI